MFDYLKGLAWRILAFAELKRQHPNLHWDDEYSENSPARIAARYNLIPPILEKIKQHLPISDAERDIVQFGFYKTPNPTLADKFILSMQQIREQELKRKSSQEYNYKIVPSKGIFDTRPDAVPGFTGFGKLQPTPENIFEQGRYANGHIGRDEKGNLIFYNSGVRSGRVINQSQSIAHYDPQLSNKFIHFDDGSRQLNDWYLHPNTDKIEGTIMRPFVSLDIETDDYMRPIQISAQKFFYNTKSGLFELADQYQRFYEADNKNLRKTFDVHGLTSDDLFRLRTEQFSSGYKQYDKTYTADERNSLRQFLESSIIVGHNILDFDLPTLGFRSGVLPNSTIDTLVASRNIWPRGDDGEFVPNDLDSVFQRIFHKTMEEEGLPHHDARSDTIATMMVLQAMAHWKGQTSDEIRAVMSGETGFHISPYDSIMESGLIKGGYNNYMADNKWDVYLNLSDSQKDEFLSYIEQTEAASENASDAPGISIEEIPDDNVRKKKPGSSKSSRPSNPPSANDWGTLSDVFKDLRSTLQATSATLDSVKAVFAGSQGLMSSLHEEASTEGYWRKRNVAMKLSRLDLRSDRIEMLNAMDLDEQGEGKGILAMADHMYSSDLSRGQRKFIHDRDRKADKLYMQGKINASQRDELKAINSKYLNDQGREETLAETYERLGDAMDSVIMKNQKLSGVFSAISSIPMYNFERLEQVFRGEVNGIRSASKGLVSDAIYSPFSRLVDASMNSLTSQNAGLKFGVRAGTAIGSGLIGVGGAMAASGVGTVPGLILMGVGGLASIVSQIYGNYREKQITQWGEDIQNNLNSIGMMKEFILMPFRLLASAVRNLIKGFGMLSSVIRGFANLMTSGLGSMTQMGNPLTGMTGVGYGDYMGSISIDHASLLGRGTVNGMYEDIAQQRMKLYTTGQLDTNRLVASSMLGVFNPIYGSTMNEEDSLTAAMNHLREITKTESDIQRKQTYVLANMINPNMGALLQTIDTLGIDNFADMKHPVGMWGYGEGALDKARQGWQRAQWEYGYAGEQLNISKMNIGVRLWDAFGKPVYNTINKLAYSISNMDWKSAGTQIKELWEIVKEGASSLWDAVKEAFGMDKNITLSAYLKGTVKNAFIDLGIGILEAIKEWYPKVMNIWDLFVDGTLKRMSTFITALGTIRIDFDEFVKMLRGEKHKVWLTSAWDAAPVNYEEGKNLYNTSKLQAAYDAIDEQDFEQLKKFDMYGTDNNAYRNYLASHYDREWAWNDFNSGNAISREARNEDLRHYKRSLLEDAMNVGLKDDAYTYIMDAAALSGIDRYTDTEAIHNIINSGDTAGALKLYDRFRDLALRKQLGGLTDITAFAATDPDLFSATGRNTIEENSTVYKLGSSVYKTMGALRDNITLSGIDVGINMLQGAKNVLDVNLSMENKPIVGVQVSTDGSAISKIWNRTIDIKNEDSSVKFYINATAGRAGN